MSIAPALTRGLKIIDYVREKKEVTFSDISSYVDYSTSSLSRLLTVLREEGYLEKNIQGNYILGIKLVSLNNSNKIYDRIIRISNPYLTKLRDTYKIAAVLYGYFHHSTIMLDKVIDKDNLAMRDVGDSKKDLLLNPCGYLYINSIADPSLKEKFIKTLKEYELLSLKIPDDNLIEFFLEMSKKSYICDDLGKIINKRRRITTPIYYKGKIISAIGIGTFTEIYTEDTIEKIKKTLKIYANEITATLKQGEL